MSTYIQVHVQYKNGNEKTQNFYVTNPWEIQEIYFQLDKLEYLDNFRIEVNTDYGKNYTIIKLSKFIKNIFAESTK
jgi:hypothetical protein